MDIINLPEKHDQFLLDFIKDYAKTIYSVGGKSQDQQNVVNVKAYEGIEN